jgi:hypothetical protein
MDIKIIVALIGILGVLVSALVQYYLGRQAEGRKKIIEIRAQAYLDLLNSVSEIAGSTKHSEARSLEQLQKLTQAKTRAVLVGSNEVVLAIELFWREHGVLNTKEACSAFTSIVSAMRKDLSGKNSLSISLLNGALFGAEFSA